MIRLGQEELLKRKIIGLVGRRIKLNHGRPMCKKFLPIATVGVLQGVGGRMLEMVMNLKQAGMMARHQWT